VLVRVLVDPGSFVLVLPEVLAQDVGLVKGAQASAAPTLQRSVEIWIIGGLVPFLCCLVGVVWVVTASPGGRLVVIAVVVDVVVAVDELRKLIV
jgi:hypothetical protein